MGVEEQLTEDRLLEAINRPLDEAREVVELLALADGTEPDPRALASIERTRHQQSQTAIRELAELT